MIQWYRGLGARQLGSIRSHIIVAFVQRRYFCVYLIFSIYHLFEAFISVYIERILRYSPG